VDLLWEHSAEHLQASEEELPYVEKGDLAIAADSRHREKIKFLV